MESCRPKKKARVHTSPPEDILLKIISLLPTKTYRNWSSLIKDPLYKSYKKCQINHLTTHSLLYSHNNSRWNYRYFVFNGDLHKPLDVFDELWKPKRIVKIVDSCNGLVCVSRLESQSRWYFYVCNPITRESVKISRIPDDFKHIFYTHSLLGFGYDEGTQEYKVVITICFRRSDKKTTGVFVYTLGSQTWRKVEEIPGLFITATNTQVVLNSVLHWKIAEFSAGSGNNNHICAFDIGNEKFCKFEMPLNEDGATIRTLGALKGCLCVVDQVSLRRSTIIWTMKDYQVKTSWTREYVIVEENINSFWRKGGEFFRVLAGFKDGNLLFHGREGLGYYDLEKNEFERIVIQGIRDPLSAESIDIVFHVASLVSPRRVDKCNDKAPLQVSLLITLVGQ